MELWYTEEWTENVRFSIKVDKHLFSDKSKFQQVDVFESKELGKFLTLDGLMMVNYKDEFIYHDMIVHVPMATNMNIKNVLVIGGGDGGTVRELTRYPKIEKIDMVEIDKMVVDVSKQYIDICACKLDDNRVNLYYEDGVNFVKDSKDKSYDLIIVDSTDPIGPGEGLFSVDFYKDCYRILGDDGILVNQNESPYFEFNAKEMKRANEKIRGLFPITKVYQAHIPTYPSGHWLFGFASKKFDPIDNQNKIEWENLNLKTKYYNSDIHKGAFMLPQYVRDMLNEK
ncbi:polyamine aminopropyltransferase [Romboutsia lituseburensis]|uniref:Polyamine aminopropyltransferase n=1 Tax=Romboutsia lituseburensis DSM 797 TaxID=1121325 RepID=A0A1G9L386_9FIRM|nr:polyamine aminopropyltransferase [Romboutsia lituseburensis]CEH35132.1 Spermidine synthase [Romboutsia lituseburensis]SDL56294.1 spermidine synthase [Romboutsia lituseburensis DSM 797]